MKILVCISKTPDTTAKIAFTENNTKFSEEGVTFILNPADEWYALVRALELKESQGGSVHVAMAGREDCEAVIRKALALGADEAFRINASPADSFCTAQLLSALCSQGGYDLILCGTETIDYNGSAVAGMLAAQLDWSFVSMASHLELQDGKALVNREIEGGEERCEVPLPVVISCMKGMAEQRIPNIRGIMAARTKPLHVVEPAACEALTRIESFELPAAKKGVKLIDPENPAELLRLLHEEAKIL